MRLHAVRPGRVSGLLVALQLALALSGCGEGGVPDPPDPCDAVDGTPRIELGTGETLFEPLEDGDTLPLVCGAQGGYHVWASVRVDGLDLTQLTLDFEQSFAATQTLDGRSTVRVNLASSGGERVGISAFFGTGFDDPSGFDPLGRDGQQMQFLVVARDACGNSASDAVSVVLDSGCALGP